MDSNRAASSSQPELLLKLGWTRLLAPGFPHVHPGTQGSTFPQNLAQCLLGHLRPWPDRPPGSPLSQLQINAPFVWVPHSPCWGPTPRVSETLGEKEVSWDCVLSLSPVCVRRKDASWRSRSHRHTFSLKFLSMPDNIKRKPPTSKEI